jgi:hypothetical protein
MAKRTLHPKMVAHGQAVSAAHAHLSRTVPGFRQLSGREQLKATQAHVRGTRRPRAPKLGGS